MRICEKSHYVRKKKSMNQPPIILHLRVDCVCSSRIAPSLASKPHSETEKRREVRMATEREGKGGREGEPLPVSQSVGSVGPLCGTLGWERACVSGAFKFALCAM